MINWKNTCSDFRYTNIEIESFISKAIKYKLRTLFLLWQKKLNVSHNNLTDMPLGLPDYWSASLETLNLSHNRLADIQQNICRLGTKWELCRYLAF